MGGLLSRSNDSKKSLHDAFIDFESAQPKTDEERAVYDGTVQVLQKAPGLLDELKNYGGADEFIRQAIQTPSEQTIATAWAQCLPMVEKLKNFYEFSLELAENLPALIIGMTEGPGDHVSSIMQNEALVKLFADMVSFAFEFDSIKLRNPSIQNDFSYYKRSLQRMQMDMVDTKDLSVTDELATLISMFYAVPNPMIMALCKGTEKCKQPKLNKTLETMATVCLNMVKGDTSKFQDEEKTTYYILRVMTAIIVIYDNVSEISVFHKKSDIDVKGAIVHLQKLQAESTDTPDIDAMLNAIHWSTRTFNDTPKDIKKLFE